MRCLSPGPGRAFRARVGRRRLPAAVLAVTTALAAPIAVRSARAAPGDVLHEQKISATAGGFVGPLDPEDNFGFGASAGDIDGDGVNDLAIGASRDDDGGESVGAVYILFMNPDGTVRDEQKISATSGGFGGILHDGDIFGSSVAGLGDLDGDGVCDLAVGAYADDDGGAIEEDLGAVWILFLNPDGTVKDEQKISMLAGGFGGDLDPYDYFGEPVASLGDLDADGVNDLVVGAAYDDDGTNDAGAVWIIFLNTDGTVKDEQKISATEGGFGGTLEENDHFASVGPLGDLNGDGVNDLAVGAGGDDDGAASAGAVWILFLNQGGTVASEQKISATEGGFGGTLDAGDLFGNEVAALGDIDGDGVNDVAAGAPFDDDGAIDAGAVWILFMNDDGTVAGEQKISATSGGFGGTLDTLDYFAYAVGSLGDLDRDGRPELVVSAAADDDGGTDFGAVWVIFLDAAPSPTFDPPNETLAAGAGDYVAVGDLDSDGDTDAVIVLPGDDPGIDGHVQVFRNQGTDSNGGWLGFVTNPVVEVGRQPSGVAVGFLDADAHLDLAVTNAGDDNVTILINTGAGDGTFAFDQNITVGTAPQAIASADFDDAGLDDLAVANAGDDNVTLLSNATVLPGGSIWVPGVNIPVGDEPVSLEPEDFEDDKGTDLIVANRSSGTVTVLLLDAGAPGSTQTVAVGGSPVDVAAADLDDNGFADAAVALESDDVVAIITNTGGVFGAPETVTVGTGAESVDLVDLDNDGDPDIAVVAQDSNAGPAIQILENLGAPAPLLGTTGAAFGVPAGYAMGANPNHVVSADLDDDGRTDLLTANVEPATTTDGSVAVLLNLPCPGDTDSSGDVGFGDMTNVLLNWGACPAPPANCPWDLDSSGDVGFGDLTLLLLQWGTCE